MYRHTINPRRTASGTVPIFSPTNTGAVALYNDSTTFRLAIWAAGNINTSISVIFAYPLHGKLATLVGPGSTIWTNQAAIAGQLYSDDLASPPATGPSSIPITFPGGFFDTRLPTWILDPGWSYVLLASTANSTMGAGFIWEELTALAFPPNPDAYDGFDQDVS